MVFRKLASLSKPIVEILVNNDAVKIIVKASLYSYISRFKCVVPEVSQSF